MSCRQTRPLQQGEDKNKNSFHMQKAPSNDTQLKIINLMVGITHLIPQIAENQWTLKVIRNVLKLSQYLQQICSNIIQT